MRQQEGRILVFSAYHQSTVLCYVLTHDVCLGPDGHQTVDVLADGHQDFTGHMTTLLRTRRLVLNMDCSCSLFHKKFGQLHNRREASMTGICICDYWSQEVGVGDAAAVCSGRCDAFFTLLAVVEKLGHEEMLDLVGDSVLWSSVMRPLPIDLDSHTIG